MKVYVITSGEYSDYGIDAVFTDKALAEEYADRNPSRRIETYEANKEVPEPAEVRWYYVNINTKDTSRIGVGYEMCEKMQFNYVQAYYSLGSSYCCFGVKADSTSKAKAIALERYHALLAVKDTHYPLLAKLNRYDKSPIYEYFSCNVVSFDGIPKIEQVMQEIKAERIEYSEEDIDRIKKAYGVK